MLLESFKLELHDMLTKKINLVVLFILPIMVMLLIGFELDNEVISNIPVAVIDKDQSDFSRQLVNAFDQNEIFNVVSYPNSEQGLEQEIRNSDVRVGMIIPEGFYQDVATLESPTVLMLYDGSHMSMTGTAKAKAMEILLTYKAGATISQLTGRLGMSQDEALNVAQVFKFVNRNLYNPSKSFEDFLGPILMAGYVQAAMVLLAAVSINHEVYTYNRKDRMGYGIGKALFYTLAGTLSYTLCIGIQVFIFKMPFKGQLFDAIILSAGLCFAVASASTVISAVIRNRMIALLGGGIVFIPNSVMAGTTWPLSSMPIGYQGFAKYMPFAHYVNNLRNIYLKGVSLSELGSHMRFFLIFGLVCLCITELVLLISVKEEVEDDVSKNIQNNVPINI